MGITKAPTTRTVANIRIIDCRQCMAYLVKANSNNSGGQCQNDTDPRQDECVFARRFTPKSHCQTLALDLNGNASVLCEGVPRKAKSILATYQVL
jgi:hypothetical protein